MRPGIQKIRQGLSYASGCCGPEDQSALGINPVAKTRTLRANNTMLKILKKAEKTVSALDSCVSKDVKSKATQVHFMHCRHGRAGL